MRKRDMTRHEIIANQVYRSVDKILANQILANAIIMSVDDEAELLQSARDLTMFRHEPAKYLEMIFKPVRIP